FNKEAQPYQFQAEDFFRSSQTEMKSATSISLLFTFSESQPQEVKQQMHHFLHPVAMSNDDGYYRIYLRVLPKHKKMAKLARATPLLTGRAIFCRWKRRNNKNWFVV